MWRARLPTCCVPYGPLTDVPYFRIKLKVLPVLCNLSRSVAPALPDLPGPGTQEVLVEVHRRSLLPPPPPRRLLVSKNLGSHLVAPRTGTRDEHVNLVAPIPSDARRICLRVHASRSSTLSRTPLPQVLHLIIIPPRPSTYLTYLHTPYVARTCASSLPEADAHRGVIGASILVQRQRPPARLVGPRHLLSRRVGWPSHGARMIDTA